MSLSLAFDPKPLAAVVGVSVLVGYGMREWGGREGRHYAVAVAGAVLICGLDYVYELPLYAYLVAIVLAPLLYHRGVRSRLKPALAKLGPIELNDLGIRLVAIDHDPEKYLGIWRAEPVEREPDPNHQSIMARPKAVDEVGAGSRPESLMISLEFEGEMDDDYDIILTGEGARPFSGQLMLFHRESIGGFTSVHEHHTEVDAVSGTEEWMRVRSDPPGYAFRLLDARALEILHELFVLQSEDRQMYTVVEGDKVRVVATRTFEKEDLQKFLTFGALWIQKVRENDGQ